MVSLNETKIHLFVERPENSSYERVCMLNKCEREKVFICYDHYGIVTNSYKVCTIKYNWPGNLVIIIWGCYYCPMILTYEISSVSNLAQDNNIIDACFFRTLLNDYKRSKWINTYIRETNQRGKGNYLNPKDLTKFVNFYNEC